MAYSDFTLERALRDFGLDLMPADLFAGVQDSPISAMLRDTLDENVSLATLIHTEKARSELIVSPILLEVRRRLDRRIGLFSGTGFDVDPARGLTGWVDFLLTRSPVQLVLRAPVCVIVEAKNDNIQGGLGQCIATMVAARLYNEKAADGPTTIFGAVTTGSLWRFLKLEAQAIAYDRAEFLVDQPGKIVAALIRGVGDLPTPIAA